MRSRMSRSYINELRGKSQQNINSPNENLPHLSTRANDSNDIQPKPSSLSLPYVRFHKKLSSSCQSAITLRDLNKSDLTDLSRDENNNKEENLRTKSTSKTNNQLIVPSRDDYRIRISNTTSIEDEQQDIPFNESRLSDALGYLRMYQNHNRVQFNALQFNDRVDLQVNKSFEFLL